MDPFAALGAAAAIAQFIEQGISLVNGARQIHKSAFGSTAENQQLGTVIQECQLLSEKILGLLQKANAKDPSSIGKSAAAALRNAWNDKEKKALVEQLEKCRNMMHTQLTESSTISRLDDLIKTGKSNTDQLAALRTNVNTLQSGVKVTKLGPVAEQQLDKIMNISKAGMIKVAQSRILEIISFADRDRRRGSIAKAEFETFTWILNEESEENEKRSWLRNWLQSQNGIFHIVGKPGSGKSTLMRFLCKEQRTIKLLEALLYDVLTQCPDLIAFVFPVQWKEVLELPWQATATLYLNSDDLDEAFLRLIDNRNSEKPRHFCFFIDGLDEFDSTGKKQDHGDLVKTIRDWTCSTIEDPQRCEDIKLCVSSREGNPFMDKFLPPLKLQDLNFVDLLTFVQERLTSHEEFHKLEFTKDITQDSFIEQIASRAEGVFLWAALVMNTIREGLYDNNGLSELQAKLESTPSEIDNLFGDLISLFAYSFLDDFSKDPEFAFKLHIGPRLCDKEINQRLQRARKQLIARCRGLVEIKDRVYELYLQSDYVHDPSFLTSALKHEITVVHRSIHEYLQSAENNKWMEQYLEVFSPTEAICQLTVATIKRLGPLTLFRAEDVPVKFEDISAWLLHSDILQVLHCLRGHCLPVEIQSKMITCLGELLPRLPRGDASIRPKVD
ncbi:hypothetical protein N431DRAFT_472287 [Stipitochalara longipes BDJ]|nr:hypothetical protein N431DRAFT_472287 [Stipitochalara longipes BDJ]